MSEHQAGRRRRRTAQALAVVAASAACLVVAVPAQAHVTAATGAAAHTWAYCHTDTVSVFSTRTEFEWRRTWIHSNGQWRETPWRKLSLHGETKDVYLTSGWTWAYVQYADDLGGGRFVFAGEFATMSGSSGPSSCLAF